ncbi:MAG: hypothetical protein LBU39_03165 [Desulfobulbaceae bacterium]|jgi:hypothetical protein|nr:hypothetical protein [Desulfobulbaceae bacterium]
MKYYHILIFLLVFCLVFPSLSGCATTSVWPPYLTTWWLPDLTTTWREEALLHDGRTIVVKRTVRYQGRHAVDQRVPIGEETISFKLPDSGKTVSWTSEYDETIGRSSFKPLAVHILDDIPYLAIIPNGCFAYNKWGRPNPPYIFLMFDGKDWQRIQATDFPREFTTFNVSISFSDPDEKKMSHMDIVPATNIHKSNSRLPQPEYKNIHREPIIPCARRNDLKCINNGSQVNCEEMVLYKGAWVGPGDSIGKRIQDRKSKADQLNKKEETAW